jgi:hypothetical protein
MAPLSDIERQRYVFPSSVRLDAETLARYGLDLSDPEPDRPERPGAYVVAGPTPRNGPVVLTDGHGKALRPTPAERRWLDWDRRRQLRAELFATAAAREASLATVAGLRHGAATLRQRAVDEEAAGRPAHARQLRDEANQAEVGAERHEGRAEQERLELQRLRDELRRAGAGKIGTWLRRGSGDVEDAPRGGVAPNEAELELVVRHELFACRYGRSAGGMSCRAPLSSSLSGHDLNSWVAPAGDWPNVGA